MVCYYLNRWLQPTVNKSPFSVAREGASYIILFFLPLCRGKRAFHFLHFEAFDHVAHLNVVEVFDA